jgi:tripeptide aminopeptidase
MSDQEQFPSTERQKDLGRMLVEELKAMGAADPHMDENGYVYAYIPATFKADEPGSEGPIVGFIAHMDTSEAASGKDIKARIVENYDGKPILLNKELDIWSDPKAYPELLHYVGQDLIVTDGTTLLGADDKAGIAEIMAMAEYLLAHPEIKHRRIPVAFTPDEEVGRGVDFFNQKTFAADFAYTVDGGAAGEIEYENFNAASAKIKIHGTSVHPGSAKNKMKHAALIAMEFQGLLPRFEDPAATEGREGFYHLITISGDCENAEMSYIIRDHDMAKFEAKKAFIQKCAEFINEKYGAGTLECQVRDGYYNMIEQIRPHWHLIENAQEAIRACGLEPISMPVRGGTDGSRLSYEGLPCPNLGVGGHNCHGRFEFACIQSMEKSVEILKKIVELYSK